MEKIAGGFTGLILAGAILIVGLVQGAPPVDTLVRAILGLGAGFMIGWLVFGPLAHAFVQQNLPKTERLPPLKSTEPPKELAD